MEQGRQGKAFVGFYWTLPVPRFGFTQIPSLADEAVAASRTIRYQREVVRHWAEDVYKGHVAAEHAWMELQPDRGSLGVREPLTTKVLGLCQAHNAELLYVDFGLRFGWRKHGELRDALQHLPLRSTPLPPDPIEIDGRQFDPVAHFRRWRQKVDEVRMAPSDKREYAVMLLELISPYLPPETTKPDYKAGAEFLDDRGLRTTSGQSWTADSLRMFLNNNGPVV